MGRRAGVLAALAVFAASACSGAPGLSSASSLDDVGDADPDSGAAGQADSDVAVTGTCLSGERLADTRADLAEYINVYGLAAYQIMADDPIWTDTVDCLEPHVLEVYGAVTLPDDLAEQVSSYADLLEEDTPLANEIRDSVTRDCAMQLDGVSSVAESAPIDLDVVPLTTPAVGHFTWNPVPEESWADGDHSIGCLFEQPTPGTARVQDLVTAAVPQEQRICLDGTTFVSCDRAHDVERIATLLVDRAVAAHELAGVRAVDESGLVTLGEGQWDALDAVCQRYLATISAHPWPGIRGVADTYPELYPDDLGRYTVLCTARSAFGTATRDMIVTTRSVYDR
jgi:hypothetical protein